MRRMIDLIREAAIPASMMRSAAKGALSVAPWEMVEILVYLSEDPVFGEEARQTLSAWDEKAAQHIAGDPRTSPDVLAYFLEPENLRIPLLNTLLANQGVPEEAIVRLAMKAPTKVLAHMLWHPRVLASVAVLHAVSMNVFLPEDDAIVVRSALANLGEDTDHLIEQARLDAEAAAEAAEAARVDQETLHTEYTKYVEAHAEEIAADEGKPFELYVPDVPGTLTGAGAVPKLINTAVDGAKVPPGQPDPSIKKKVSAFQKIANLGVGDRVQLAMKGTKDERFILIRDGSKVVSAAVIESPKLTDQEIEMFASLKSVQESVLRGISSKRKFMRNYVVQKNLCNNPRTPLDVALPLLKGLMINDLRSMAGNKNVNDTLRKMSLKLYKQRTEKKAES